MFFRSPKIILVVGICFALGFANCDNTLEAIDGKLDDSNNDIERIARSSPLRWGKRAPGKVKLCYTKSFTNFKNVYGCRTFLDGENVKR